MKKLLALALVAVVAALCFAALAEFNEDDFSVVFGDDAFEADAYEGDDAADDDAFDDDDDVDFAIDDSGDVEGDVDGFGDDALEDDDFDSDGADDGEDDFSVSFGDGGYTGEWTSVEDLQIEFFLPDGWKAGTPDEEEYYFAESEDGSSELSIVLYDDTYDGGDFAAWAEKCFDEDEYDLATVNGLDVVLLDDSDIGHIMVLVPGPDGVVVGFNFFRTSEDALSDEFAVQIAGTCTALWI